MLFGAVHRRQFSRVSKSRGLLGHRVPPDSDYCAHIPTIDKQKKCFRPRLKLDRGGEVKIIRLKTYCWYTCNRYLNLRFRIYYFIIYRIISCFPIGLDTEVSHVWSNYRD